jgi:hypothetical protein
LASDCKKDGTSLKLGAVKIRVCLALTLFVGRRLSLPAAVDWRPTWPPYKIMIATIVLAGSIFLSACGMFKPTGEQVRKEPQKTVYKASDETESDRFNLAPAQKVPGE